MKINQKNSGFGLLAVILAVVILGVIGYLVFSSSNNLMESPLSKVSEVVTKIQPSPTPFPFQELTIPYYRNREFVSSLDELDQISDNTSYTSYLTSYDSDGFAVNGLLTIPKGEMPEGGWPAVVFIHGYIPPTLYRTRENYVSYIDPLAREGLVVFKIDLRGHDQSEGEAGGGYYAGDYVIDTLNAKAALAVSDFVNPDEIGLWGHSMAGNVVFRSLVSDPGIKRAVIWAGAVYTYEDLAQFRINDNSYRPPEENTERQRKREKLRETYGEFNPEDAFWKQVVPTNYLDGVSADLQIHHATDDAVVGIGYSRNLINILQGSGITAELFEYASGGHNITGGGFTTAMHRSADFLKAY